MAIKVGINGFGRIGRMVFRAAARDFKDIEIVGINDLLEPEYLAYMLKFDSVHGRFKGDISVDGHTLVVNGRRIRLTAIKDPAELKWGEAGAYSSSNDGLVEMKEVAEKYLAVAREVILFVLSKDDMLMFVFGVNDKSVRRAGNDLDVFVMMNCLGAVAKALNEHLGHQARPDDEPRTRRRPRRRPWTVRRTRTWRAGGILAHDPSLTGAAKAVGKVIGSTRSSPERRSACRLRRSAGRSRPSSWSSWWSMKQSAR